MKFTDRMKEILMARIQWSLNYSELCGCFTYAEIVYLHETLKVVNTYGSNQSWVDYAKAHMAKGENGRMWFYFKPRRDLNPKSKTHDIKG